ncbi:MAG TPA: sulfur carrier protein ThiS [Burkholderiales bacterium]|jgi:sulfur carrier protein|nr:sulfur carrier protein ThiS [Burkholderiales bacterium]
MDTVLFNGESRPIPAPTSIWQFLEQMGLLGRRVAVEHNGVVVPRSLHEQTFLTDGDRLEVIVAVGGG